MHDPAGLFGLGEVHGMAATGHQGGDAVWDQSGHSERVRGKASVVRPGHGEDGSAQRRQKVPKWNLGARSAEPQARGQAGRSVAESLRTLRRITDLESFEQRSAQPAIDEGLDVAGSLEPVGQGVVGLASSRTFLRVLYSGGDTDEDDATQRQLVTERHVQRYPGTKGVAEERARLSADLGVYRLRHQSRRGRQVGPHRTGIAVSRQIHRKQRVGLGQELTETTPEASRLGEAVEDDQWWSRPAHVDMEWHAG
jgi:hypothetical protein